MILAVPSGLTFSTISAAQVLTSQAASLHTPRKRRYCSGTEAGSARRKLTFCSHKTRPDCCSPPAGIGGTAVGGGTPAPGGAPPAPAAPGPVFCASACSSKTSARTTAKNRPTDMQPPSQKPRHGFYGKSRDNASGRRGPDLPGLYPALTRNALCKAGGADRPATG